MSSSTAVPAASRRRILYVFATQGFAGLLLVCWVTVVRAGQTREIFDSLGSQALPLITTFFLCSLILQFLKFELTDLIFVSFGITAFIAMVPLLGMVMAAWTAVSAAIVTRLLAIVQVGPLKIHVQDPVLEYVKTFGLFGTYGIPVVLAAFVYERMGGNVPVAEVSIISAFRLALSGFVLIASNNIVMLRVMGAYGYSPSKRFRLTMIDSSIYLLTLPYAICLALAWSTIGLGFVLALSFTGIVTNFVTRGLAHARIQSRNQLQRLASLSNIGKTISLRFTKEQLLMAIYTECRRVVDVSLFSIALIDEGSSELSFELDVRENQIMPKDRIPIGKGLNSWVVVHRQPLLLKSMQQEKQFGVESVQDDIETESWLGVPMVARDRVIGVLSVQSYKQNAFSDDDVLLLTSIANQAAVALENANLYRDLEGLTYALENRVLDRTNELRETNLRLMAADRSKNQFLANMSHELRTPLNSVIGFSSVLLENTREVLPPRLFKFLENIRAAGNHLLSLINDILDLSKIEAGKMELRPDLFDIRETVASVERVMRGFASEAGVGLTVDIDSDVPVVRLDEGRLKQILFNLVSNAIKFSPKGGPVWVTVNHVPRAQSPLRCDAIRIEVSDSGIGIELEELEKIFDEFYQTEDGRRSKKGGTGLGLSLTRNFVELHHGTIEVHSRREAGATFVMHLPVDCMQGSPLPVMSAVVKRHETPMDH